MTVRLLVKGEMIPVTPSLLHISSWVNKGISVRLQFCSY